MLELEIPYPPSLNHYKKVGGTYWTKNGKKFQARVNTSATINFYKEVWVKIVALKHARRMEMPLPATISLQLCVDLYAPDKRRRDADNILKVLCDSLVKGGLIEDDSQITRLVVEKKGIIVGGKVIVRIEEFR
jgi:Holliday junction resolvase RusA-like endonuclease